MQQPALVAASALEAGRLSAWLCFERLTKPKDEGLRQGIEGLELAVVPVRESARISAVHCKRELGSAWRRTRHIVGSNPAVVAAARFP